MSRAALITWVRFVATETTVGVGLGFTGTIIFEGKLLCRDVILCGCVVFRSS